MFLTHPYLQTPGMGGWVGFEAADLSSLGINTPIRRPIAKATPIRIIPPIYNDDI